MNDSSHIKERRDHPRTAISLPAHFEVRESGSSYPSVTLDIGQSGLLIHTFKEMPVGIKLDIEVLLPSQIRLSRIRAEAEVIWKGVSYREDGEGYEYGLKITYISNGDFVELRRILSSPSCLREIYFTENPQSNPTLVVKTK